MKITKFEELWIWQQSRQLVKDVYIDFGEGTAAERDYGFKDQIQRAGVSVMNNIAEGFEKNSSNQEFARYLDISKGSCGEVRSMYYVAEDLGYISIELAAERRNKMSQICAGIFSLRQQLKT